MRLFFVAGLAGAVVAHSSVAWAQRAGENAVTSAQDAFGTQVGNESIGLYNTTDVRGFNPTEAGNLRIEGLYFDRQGDHTNRIITGSTVRVGLSAQSYPFPAPTGIVDFSLRRPGDKPLTSVVATYGPYGQGQLEVDTQYPFLDGKLSVGGGVSAFYEKTPSNKPSAVWTIGSVARWRPNDRIEVLPFGTIQFRYDREGPPNVLLAGPVLPPRYVRNNYFGQNWADLSSEQSTVGFVVKADLDDDWILRAGVFRSLNYRVEQTENLFRNTRGDGRGDREAIILPPNRLDSTSGEFRLSRTWTGPVRRHTVHASLRGRYKLRTYGGGVTIPLGPGIVGVSDYEPEPQNVVFGPMSAARVWQGTLGVAYEGIWREVGELSFGLQKSVYRRRNEQPGLPNATSRDNPWLANATIAAYLTRDLAVYASYTNGLEESAEAPQNAVNRGEAVAASRTSQIDAGFRYALTPALRLVVGVFEVKKPYFNLNTASIYTELGDVRHRGIEFSVAGRVVENLTVVAGATLLQARVTGPLVTSGRIGRIPLGRFPHKLSLNLQYALPFWRGVALDAQAERYAARYIDVLNTAQIDPYTLVNLGARYNFAIAGNRTTLRLQMQNVGGVFRWQVSPSANFIPIETRRFTASLSADF